METETSSSVDIYPVGVLAELLRLRRALTNYDTKATGWAVGRLRAEMRSVAARVRQRDWRAVKNKFNGYLAEPTPFPEGVHRCGSGWTKRRAMRSLRRHGYRG
ncbi:hypothetical protein [Micromonospora profundi]|uniref:hypothetical protein n=1 Tax=Micromonospora profundi TaxID=1420889 RepID=UPI00364B5EF2